MTKISTVIDTIYTTLASLNSGSTRIPNPYELSENNCLFLRKGYGLKVGSGNFEDHEFCNFMIKRNFTVVFTREYFRQDSQTAPMDTAVKELLEAIVATQASFYSYAELGIPDSIAKVDLGSVSEVETFFAEKNNFISMSAEFEFFIKESIS